MILWHRHVAGALAVLGAAVAFRAQTPFLAAAVVLALLAWAAAALGRQALALMLTAVLAGGGFLLPLSAFDERAWALALSVVLLLEATWSRGGRDAAAAWTLPLAIAALVGGVIAARAVYLPLRLSMGRPETALPVILAYGSLAALLALLLLSGRDGEAST